jgi:glucuronate isomerase
MSTPLTFHPDRIFSSDPTQRSIAGALYERIRDLPIVSPHGHTDPAWFAANERFADPARLLVMPDHYLLRMLYSKGIAFEDLGIAGAGGPPAEANPRVIWRRLAANYHLFRGTPSRYWLDYVFHEVFGLRSRLDADSADFYYDRMEEQLASPAFLPRALFERFRIETLATTESPTDELVHHRTLRESGWKGRVITTFRPDPVVDPEFAGFAGSVARLGELTGEDSASWSGYLSALRKRRGYFMQMGATATDHGHPSALTADLPRSECERLFAAALAGKCTALEAELFRAQMLTEMAAMSVDDGLVMQLHPGSFRNHNPLLYQRFGRDRGADIPTATDYVRALKPLLDRFGNSPDFRLIVFTLDETSYSRELAPLAGHYPCLLLGPPWWFHDSVEGMLRYRQQITETAGFYNTVGFNDDTRAFLSIPARHDLARRVDCRFLASLVAEHRLDLDEAHVLARELTYDLVRRAYKLDQTPLR